MWMFIYFLLIFTILRFVIIAGQKKTQFSLTWDRDQTSSSFELDDSSFELDEIHFELSSPLWPSPLVIKIKLFVHLVYLLTTNVYFGINLNNIYIKLKRRHLFSGRVSQPDISHILFTLYWSTSWVFVTCCAKLFEPHICVFICLIATSDVPILRDAWYIFSTEYNAIRFMVLYSFLWLLFVKFCWLKLISWIAQYNARM